ncbi:MAG: dipeptidase [Planctomycetota bacterium]
MSGKVSDPSRHRCTTVIVGKDATADGSVLLGHNEDWGVYEIPLRWSPGKKHKPGTTMKLKNGQVIPQVEQTYSFIWLAANWNGINEHQVAIADNAVYCRKELSGQEGGADLQDLVRIMLERSRTAREAVRIMGTLIENYGYRSPSGGFSTFSIADPNEGWWMEVIGGGLWVARRVPDDSFVVIANRLRMGEVDLKDTSQFLANTNLIEYAKQRNWYDPKQGDFSFSQVYGPQKGGRSPGNSRREWRGNCLLGGREFDETRNPLTAVPDKKLSPRHVMTLLRDHYEDTKYDLTNGYKKGSPHHTSERTICRMATDTSTVTQLRSWLPPEIGGLSWFSVGTPCCSVYVPYYLGVTDFPKPYAFVTEEYDRDNAFWLFNSLQNLVDEHYPEEKRLGYSKMRTIDHVARYWREFEDDEFSMQGPVEKTALELYHNDKSLARSFLSTYSNSLGLRAFVTARELTNTLRTKYFQ